MPLIRGPGGGILRGPGGGLATGTDCCCLNDVACPGETITEFTLNVEDLDGAWGGNAFLGPITLSLTAPNVWEADWFYDPICNAGDKAHVIFQCTAGALDGDWTLAISNAVKNQPMAGSVGAGFSQTSDTATPNWTVVFNLLKSVDGNGACWGISGPSNFRLTFTA